MKSLYLFILLISTTACGLFSTNESTNYVKSKNYSNTFLNQMPANWNQIKNESSDFAILNSKTNSILLLNSACRKTESSSLTALSSSILTGIENVDIISKEKITLFEREAIEIKASGQVDGVKTFFNITTIQKNFCIYDYVLISKNLKKLEQDYSTYKMFVNGIIPQ